MGDRDIEGRIAELLHYPIAGRIPDIALSALYVWWLRKRGVLRSSP